MAELNKDQLKALFDKFNPAWKAQFETELGSDAPWLAKLGRKMYNTDSGRTRAFTDFANLVANGVSEEDALARVGKFYGEAMNSPFSAKGIDLGDITTVGADGASVTNKLVQSPIGRTASIGGGIIKNHPWQAAGATAGTLGSLAGLFDNDKIAGQLIGTAAGAIIPAVANVGLSPLTAYTIATGAGTLGSLFDTLRAKKADERAAVQRRGKEEYVR